MGRWVLGRDGMGGEHIAEDARLMGRCRRPVLCRHRVRLPPADSRLSGPGKPTIPPADGSPHLPRNRRYSLPSMNASSPHPPPSLLQAVSHSPEPSNAGCPVRLQQPDDDRPRSIGVWSVKAAPPCREIFSFPFSRLPGNRVTGWVIMPPLKSPSVLRTRSPPYRSDCKYLVTVRRLAPRYRPGWGHCISCYSKFQYLAARPHPAEDSS